MSILSFNDLIRAISANHNVPPGTDRRRVLDEEEAARAEDTAQTAIDEPQQLAYNDAGLTTSDAPLQLAQAETAAGGAGGAGGGAVAGEAAAAGTAAGTAAAAGGIGMGALALGAVAVGGIAAAAGGGGGSDSPAAAPADTTAPTATVNTATHDTALHMQSSETGTAYLVNTSVTVSSLTDITGAADDLQNSVAIGTANTDTALALTGLQAGSYQLYTVDAAGNLSVAASAQLTVAPGTDSANDVARSVIDLGDYGKLIAPVQVEDHWYYYWDRSGDGTSANSGSLNGGLDYPTHDVLDGIFANDISGTANTTVANADGLYGTTDTYRYATLNGVNLALPTAGELVTGGGTAVADGATTNGTYDDLLAIWDAHNGADTGTNVDGTPSGWQADAYWSATPSGRGHADVILFNGGVVNVDDDYEGFGAGGLYVALEVL